MSLPVQRYVAPKKVRSPSTSLGTAGGAAIMGEATEGAAWRTRPLRAGRSARRHIMASGDGETNVRQRGHREGWEARPREGRRRLAAHRIAALV